MYGGKLDVQLRVPCRRDVIFSCCNSSLARESSSSLSNSRRGVCVVRAPSFSRSRGEDRRRTRVCTPEAYKSDEQLAKPVSYIFHVPICASHAFVGVLPKNFAVSKEKRFCSDDLPFLLLFFFQTQKNHLFLHCVKLLSPCIHGLIVYRSLK